jgi:hypothetical protein
LAQNPIPVLIMHYFGAGKVILQTTDETYRWAQYLGDDRYYSRYWLQLIHYLCQSSADSNEQPATVLTDRSTYFHGDVVRFRAQFSDSGLPAVVDGGARVMVESRHGQRRELELLRDPAEQRVFRGFVNDLDPGSYRVWLSYPRYDPPPDTVQFEVQPPDNEQARLQMQVDELREAAEVSRGRFYNLEECHKLPDDLPRGRQVRIETLPPEPIWNSGWLAAAVVCLLTAEWLLRRRAGLV